MKNENRYREEGETKRKNLREKAAKGKGSKRKSSEAMRKVDSKGERK